MASLGRKQQALTGSRSPLTRYDFKVLKWTQLRTWFFWIWGWRLIRYFFSDMVSPKITKKNKQNIWESDYIDLCKLYYVKMTMAKCMLKSLGKTPWPQFVEIRSASWTTYLVGLDLFSCFQAYIAYRFHLMPLQCFIIWQSFRHWHRRPKLASLW